MATGAGKTLTALVCAARVQDRLGDVPLLIVVSAPSVPLVMQWKEEVAKFGMTAVAPSLESDANVAITNLFRRLSGGGTQVLIATNALLCSSAFQTTLALKVKGAGSPCATMFIGDEAHTLGSEGFIANKPEFFERRLALSATPERQYDPDGTEEIFAFFGPPVYDFGLERAIGFCLVPYDYFVHAATLDGDELHEFAELSARIGAAVGRGADEETVTRLRIARRRIIETAQLKISLLRQVLMRRGPRSLTHALVYVSAKNPDQFGQTADLLTELDVRWAPVTQDTTRNARLLKQTLETFTEGGYQVLLAKKVLDEGVDIPSIREAFIVASSTVHREWVQRRGRVLRIHPGKSRAMVHDFLALPPADMVTLENRASMLKIIRTELDRAYSFAAHSRNAGGHDGVMADLQRIRGAYWPDNATDRVLAKPGEMLIASNTPEGAPW
jgi:superfamily II DNA or RNA helicase